MPPGRPIHSQIRTNIIEILFYLGRGYGYQIAKIYNELFPEVTQRSIYYHLRKGEKTKEIELNTIEEEKGDFSWGNTVEKIYYTLGTAAKPNGETRIEDYLKKHGYSLEPQLPKKKFTKFVDKFRKGKYLK